MKLTNVSCRLLALLAALSAAGLATLALLSGLVYAAAPPLPSSFYGTVTLDGVDAPPGVTVTAWISNSVYATVTTFFNEDGDTAYLLHAPGDDPDTPAQEGGGSGATVSFQVTGFPAIEQGTWSSGAHSRQDLTAFSTPQPPAASFVHTPTVAFISETVVFTDTSSDIDGSIIAWGWNFADGDTSATQHPGHVYATHGIYSVTLTVTDTDALTGTAQGSVRVMALPQPEFDYTPGDPRAGEIVQFNDLSSDPDGTIINWARDFGDTGSSALQNPQHTFTVAGDYFVTPTVTDDDGNTDFLTQQIYVGTAGSIVAWQWDFDNGTGSALPNPSHTYSTTFGLFIVTLTVTDSAGYTDTMDAGVLVTLKPSAAFTHTPPLPGNNQLVQFTDISSHPDPTATIVDWAWNFGDSAGSPLQDPSHAFSTGQYSVTLVITDSHGLTDTTALLLTSNDAPTADAGGPYGGDEGDDIFLSAAGSSDPDGSLSGFAWVLDEDGQFDDDTGISALVNYDDDGLFTVGVVVTDI